MVAFIILLLGFLDYTHGCLYVIISINGFVILPVAFLCSSFALLLPDKNLFHLRGDVSVNLALLHYEVSGYLRQRFTVCMEVPPLFTKMINSLPFPSH